VVLNLGAGLDGRPYRMSLPTHLRWVEVDFPSIIEFKSAALDKHSPVCNLQRIGMDLLDLPLRHDLFSRCLGISEPSLVITEGILVYLSNDEAASLARAILDNPAVRYWIQDYDNAGSRPLPRGWEKKLRAAPFRLQAPDWFGFFEQCGWKPLTIITSADEAKRIHRPYPYDFPYGLLMRALPSGMRQKIMSLSGAVLMQRI
jgi:O-methyltransferase involved in polyketide biosynthesis